MNSNLNQQENQKEKERDEAETLLLNLLGNGPTCNICGEVKFTSHSKFVCKLCVLGFGEIDELVDHCNNHHKSKKVNIAGPSGISLGKREKTMIFFFFFARYSTHFYFFFLS